MTLKAMDLFGIKSCSFQIPQNRDITLYEILKKNPGKDISYTVRDKDLEGRDFAFRPVEFHNLANKVIPSGGVRLSPQLIKKYKIKIP